MDGIVEVKKKKDKSISDVYTKLSDLKKDNKKMFTEIMDLKVENKKIISQNDEIMQKLEVVIANNIHLKEQNEMLLDRLLGSASIKKKWGGFRTASISLKLFN